MPHNTYLGRIRCPQCTRATVARHLCPRTCCTQPASQGLCWLDLQPSSGSYSLQLSAAPWFLQMADNEDAAAALENGGEAGNGQDEQAREEEGFLDDLDDEYDDQEDVDVQVGFPTAAI